MIRYWFIRLSGAQRLGLAVLLALMLFAIAESLLGHHDAARQALQNRFALPGGEHLLGTDQFGRSMVARMAAAVRLSFILSISCVVTSAVIGTGFGVWAAWRGGWVDHGLNFLVNTILALPGLVLVLLCAALVPGSFFMLYFAIAMTLWVEYFRIVRASVLSIINGPQIQSSSMLGFGRWYLFRRHIWPSIQQDVFTLAAFGAATSVLTMASVGFVYVGLKPPASELGLMIVELFPYYADAPWALAQPLLALFMMVLGFNLLARKSS
ncbi:ABC transporter permease [Gynuella sp.]|uniref:ABC transporter permease n=1 Tax=Gynuella sp. TaxID=2969146 RepID=UPI003D0E559F